MQYQLADSFGSTQSSISGIERRRADVSAADLANIADILGKPITFFFPRADNSLTDREQQLLHMLRSLAADSQQAVLAGLAAQFDLHKAKPLVTRPKP